MPAGDVRSVHLPYCLQQQPDGRYVILNRNYKPLGFITQEHLRYDDYPIAVHLGGLGPSTAAKLSWEGSTDLTRIYLYSDNCIPTSSASAMQRYLDRLAILARLKIKPS